MTTNDRSTDPMPATKGLEALALLNSEIASAIAKALKTGLSQDMVTAAIQTATQLLEEADG
jgi:hypothetical protein